jgi:hypothetical protein
MKAAIPPGGGLEAKENQRNDHSIKTAVRPKAANLSFLLAGSILAVFGAAGFVRLLLTVSESTNQFLEHGPSAGLPVFILNTGLAFLVSAVLIVIGTMAIQCYRNEGNLFALSLISGATGLYYVFLIGAMFYSLADIATKAGSNLLEVIRQGPAFPLLLMGITLLLAIVFLGALGNIRSRRSAR